MVSIELRKWNSAEHLQTVEDIVAYFDAYLEEAGDDASSIAHALVTIARARERSQVARDSGFAQDAQRDIGAELLQAVRELRGTVVSFAVISEKAVIGRPIS